MLPRNIGSFFNVYIFYVFKNMVKNVIIDKESL